MDARWPLNPRSSGSRGAYLWVVHTPPEPAAQSAGLPELNDEFSRELSDSERQRADAFRVPGKRHRYLLGRQLLRNVLAQALDLAPRDVGLESGHNDRPQLTPAMAERARVRFGQALDFNLSSTPGRLALGLAFGGRIGVDVEAPKALEDLPELARTVLGTEELSWMEQQAHPRDGFYRLWTLKEAAAKAHGEGLGLPFRKLRIQPDDQGGLITDLDVLDSPHAHWSLLSLEASGPAALAVDWSDGKRGAIDLSLPLPPGLAFEQILVKPTARLRVVDPA